MYQIYREQKTLRVLVNSNTAIKYYTYTLYMNIQLSSENNTALFDMPLSFTTFMTLMVCITTR